jgi:hypothetical protein
LAVSLEELALLEVLQVELAPAVALQVDFLLVV